MKPETILMGAIFGEKIGDRYEKVDSEFHEQIDGVSLKEALMQALGTLKTSHTVKDQWGRDNIKRSDPREKHVLLMRFGFTSPDGLGITLEKVGYEFNVTRERIRQIEARALRKLRHPSRSSPLEKFIKHSSENIGV